MNDVKFESKLLLDVFDDLVVFDDDDDVEDDVLEFERERDVEDDELRLFFLRFSFLLDESLLSIGGVDVIEA